LTGGGEVCAFALDTGRVLHRFPSGRALANVALLPLPDDRYARADESRLAVYGRDGHVRWEADSRAARGLTPPAYGALAGTGGRLYVGATDGAVECRQSQTGQVLWSVGLEAAVDSLHAAVSDPERVLAVTGNGLVFGLRDGKILWRADVSQGL